MNVEFNKPYSVKLLLPGSPSRFWLSFLDSTSRDKIEEELRQTYEKGVSLRDPPCPGTFIVCFYSGKFCRAKVVMQLSFVKFNRSHCTVILIYTFFYQVTTLECNTVIPAGTQMDVVLVDYGESIRVSMNQLYPIQQRFCRDPAYGLLCCLNDLEPTNTVWEMDGIMFFTEQIQCQDLIATFHRPKDREITATFSNFSPDFYVSLKKKDCVEESDIATDMVKQRLGKWSKNSRNYEETRSSQATPNCEVKRDPSAKSASFSSFSLPQGAMRNATQFSQATPNRKVFNGEPSAKSTSFSSSSQEQGFMRNACDMSASRTTSHPPALDSTQQLDLSSRNMTMKNQECTAERRKTSSSPLNVCSPEFIPRNCLPTKLGKSQEIKICNISQQPKSAFQKAIPLNAIPSSLQLRLSKEEHMNKFGTTSLTAATTPEDYNSIDEFIMTRPPSVEPEIFQKPTDQLLLEQFLNSVPESPLPPTRDQAHHSTTNTSEGGSFLTATSRHSHFSNHREVTFCASVVLVSFDNLLFYLFRITILPRGN